MRLLGLKWGRGDAKAMEHATKAIVAAQRSDDGWAQSDQLGSDAYATGQAMFALLEAANMPPGSPTIQRGVRYLLANQRADGSWYVRSRVIKFQPYFEGGFPYGEDQWISSMATGWATAALVRVLD
jgi:squalene cyclase